MMSEDEKINELANIFSILRAEDPQSWARSEIKENIPQLARFLILRAAWENISSEEKNRLDG